MAGYVLATRHSPEDHLFEQILGPGERFLPGLALTPIIQQVGGTDDEWAFLGGEQIDGPLREACYHGQRNAGCVMTYLVNGDPNFPIVLSALMLARGEVG